MMNSEGDFIHDNNDDDGEEDDDEISVEQHQSKSNDNDDDETRCCRRILNVTDMEMWLHSEAYRDYLNFIKLLNEFAKGVHNRMFQSRNEITDEYLQKVIRLLDHIGELCDQIEPFNDDKNQRFVSHSLFVVSFIHSFIFLL